MALDESTRQWTPQSEIGWFLMDIERQHGEIAFRESLADFLHSVHCHGHHNMTGDGFAYAPVVGAKTFYQRRADDLINLMAGSSDRVGD